MKDQVITGNKSASKYDANSGGSGAIYGNASFEGGVQYSMFETCLVPFHLAKPTDEEI
jgi:hypothetical protein